MADFRQRIISGFFILAIVVFILLALLLGNLFAGYFDKERTEKYKDHLQFLALNLTDGSDSAEITSLLEKSHEILGGTVIYYSDEGKVIDFYPKGIAPDSIEVTTVTESVNRKGLYRQRDDQFSSYVFPIRKNDSIEGYLSLNIPSQQVEQEERMIWVFLFTSLIAGLVIMLYVTYRMSNQIMKPIDDATRLAKELSKGNFKARTYEYQLEHTGRLNHSLNVLARNLEKMTMSYEIQQERLKTLIENMGSGLVLIDDKGAVNLVNRAYKEIFEMDEEGQWKDRLYHEVFAHKEIIDIIEETYLTENINRKHIVFTVNIERKHFDVYGAPILGNSDALMGIVLVFHDISEIKKLEQMRKDFVANVSHELRTPVTSLKGFAETLLEGAIDNREVSEKFLKIIWAESDRLQSLIQDLLDLSKVEQGSFALNWDKVDLASLTEDVLLLLESKADEKQIHLKSTLDNNTIIDGDAFRLKQVFINVINNSLTYTPSGGSVQVSLLEQKDVVQFIVQDTGIGMHEEEIPRIFERFYRIDKARSRNSGGTGLGLAIVKHLVEAHHGSIKVESKKNVGTKLMITFRKKRKIDALIKS
jgi:two-component system phosphate regulon sensor histidine kinase PhoR